jgi:GAF domain-containing protein
MKCSRCQQDNPVPDAQFCPRCGAPVTRAEDSSPPAVSFADLQRALREALEQQSATSEILRVISQSPADVKPVFEVITDSAMRLFSAWAAAVFRYEGQLISMAAARGGLPGSADAVMKHLQVPHAPTEERPEGRTVLTRTIQHVVDVENDMSWGPRYREDARARGFRSYVAVPMLRGDVVVGVITVSRQRVGGFASGEISLLQTFADQAVIAIENVRLFKELETRNKDLTEALEQRTATSEILRVISSSPTDVQPVFDAIVRAAVRLCSGYFGVVTRYDGHVVTFVAEHNIPAEGLRQVAAIYPGPPNPGTITGRVLLSRTVVHEHDVRHSRLSSAASIGEAAGYRTCIGVPMLRDGEPIGTISVARREVEPFSVPEIALLQTFASQAVIAIENVRLFKELEDRNRDLTATSEILQAIAASPTAVQPVFDTIVRNAVALCGAFYGIIWRYDNDVVDIAGVHNIPAGEMEELRRQFPRAIEGAAMHRHLRSGNLLDVPDVEMQQDLPIPPDARSRWRSRGVRSVVVVPMRRRAEVVGAIGVSHRDTGAFSADRINLLKTFADQAVIAIENVRLFTELQASNRELRIALDTQTATSDILRAISRSQTDVQPVFDAIVRSAVRLCGASHGGVYRFDGELVHSVVHEGFSPEQLEQWRKTWPRPMSADTSLACEAIRTRRIIRVGDIEATASVQLTTEARANVRSRGSRSVLAVPMILHDSVVGVIGLAHPGVDAFADAHVELLQTFADQAVIAIENVRLFTELQERNRDLTEALDQQTATSEILRVISSSPTDLQPVFTTIVENAAKLCDARFTALFRFDGELITVAVQHGSTPEELAVTRAVFPTRATRGTAAGRVILERGVVHIPDIRTDPEYVATPALNALGYRTVLAVPMLRQGNPIGALLSWRREVSPFTDKQVELVKTFADQAVIAIENVRLFTELQDKNCALTQAHGQVIEALERQTATSEILRTIAHAQTDVKPVFETIVRSAARLCHAANAAVFLTDGGMLYEPANFGSSPEARAAARARYPRPVGMETPPGIAILTRSIFHVPDTEDSSVIEHLRQSGRLLGFRSVVTVPMLREGEAVGAILVARRETGRFSDVEVELLRTFADQAVIAVENVRLFKELEARTTALTRSVDQLTALGEVGRAVSSTLNLETMLTTIVSRAVELSRADGGSMYEYDAAAEKFSLRASYKLDDPDLALRREIRIRKGEGAVGQLAVSREPVQIPDITTQGAYDSRLRSALLRAGARAVLAVPLLRDEHLIGGLVVSRNTPGEFPSEAVELLCTFATQSALAIQNARLFREIEDKSRQLEIASQHKSEFLANMSHELRTPLNAIIGFSELLSERLYGDLNEKQDEYLKDIHASGQHLLSLINDILDLSKIEAGRMELELTDFDLPTAIDNALMLVRERAGRRGIALHQAVDPQLGLIRADERKIKQVLLNLLSNAIKFTPDGGRIDVQGRAVDESVEVSVSDTGVGIAPEDQEAIFEEFRQVGTADKKVEGTGLGLALSRRFIELHGGRIWVESQVGVGSTFTFTIPTRQEP